MNDKVLGELLVVSLIFISSARIFFVRRVKVDALAFFALLSFPLAALLVLTVLFILKLRRICKK